MPRQSLAVVAFVVIPLAFLVACEQNSQKANRESTDTPLSPSSVSAASAPQGAAPSSPGLPDRLVTMSDACDPTSFNAMFGERTCIRSGGVQLDKFLEELGKHGSIGAWLFSPPDTSVRVGQTLVAVNRGGEVHTFTEVDEFGGGIIEPLNEITHNTNVAPECQALEDDDFVAPGGTYRETVDHTGIVKFQCCIHPWMRLEAHVTAK